MSDLKIYEVDDGGTSFTIAAKSREEALGLFKKYSIEQSGWDEQDIELAGEPDVTLIPIVNAASIEVVDNENEDPCPKCSGRGKVIAKRTLLDFYQEHVKNPKKSPYGILSCSEW